MNFQHALGMPYEITSCTYDTQTTDILLFLPTLGAYRHSIQLVFRMTHVMMGNLKKAI